jgi:hypothetical protein
MKHLQLFESYTSSEDVAEELDNWIEDNSDYISSSSLEGKINELIEDGEITVEVETIEDKGGMEYGEDWSTQVVTVRLNGKDLMKVCVNSEGRYDFGKNTLMFKGLPQDKVVYAPYTTDPRFFFDKTVL